MRRETRKCLHEGWAEAKDWVNRGKYEQTVDKDGDVYYKKIKVSESVQNERKKTAGYEKSVHMDPSQSSNIAKVLGFGFELGVQASLAFFTFLPLDKGILR